MTRRQDTRHWSEQRGRVWLWPVAVAMVLTLGALLAVVALGSSGRTAEPEASGDTGAELALFDGLPQDGITLGRPNARATLVIYTSLDAPHGSFDAALPALVERFVRPGRLALQLRTLSHDPELIVPDDGSGLRAARAAQAAGLQDRLWQFVRVLALQSPGYVDDAVLADAAARVPGLDLERMRADASSRRVAAAVRRADAMGREAGVDSAPTFVVERRGRRATTLEDVSPETLVSALERLLAAR